MKMNKLTAGRVCEEALGRKTVLCCGGGTGDSCCWTRRGPNLKLAVDEPSSGEPAGCFSASLFSWFFIFSFSYLIASRRDGRQSLSMPAALVCLRMGGRGWGASMQLCGLLRKTGAKIPAGPFRYGDGRQ